MHTRELCVTIRLDHDPSGVRAEAILRDDDHESVTGIGQVAHHRANPFPAREDLAVVRALRDLADRLVAGGRQAHPCAPGKNGATRATARAWGGRYPVQRWPTYPNLRNGTVRARGHHSVR
ncbi:MAG: dsRBD fold-containing protein [Frankiaceae bacterium]